MKNNKIEIYKHIARNDYIDTFVRYMKEENNSLEPSNDEVNNKDK